MGVESNSSMTGNDVTLKQVGGAVNIAARNDRSFDCAGTDRIGDFVNLEDLGDLSDCGMRSFSEFSITGTVMRAIVPDVKGHSFRRDGISATKANQILSVDGFIFL